MAKVVHNQIEHDAAHAELCAAQRKAEKGAIGSSWSAATQRGPNSSPALAIDLPHPRWLPSQADTLAMLAVQVMAHGVAVVYKPLMIANIAQSLTILTDGCINFRMFLVEGTKPNLRKIHECVERSLMLVTALASVIGYDKASKIAHYAVERDLTLRDAALDLGFVDEQTFDRVVDPRRMVKPYVAAVER